MVRGTEVVLNLGWFTSHYRDKTLLCTLLNSLWTTRFSSLPSGKRHYSQPCVSAGTVNLTLLGASVHSFKFPPMGALITLSWMPGKDPLQFSLPLCSRYLVLWTLSRSSWFLSSILLTQLQLTPPPSILAWEFSQDRKLGNHWSHLSVSLWGITDLHCLLLSVLVLALWSWASVSLATKDE